MKLKTVRAALTRGIVLDTLMYEIYLAPSPADPDWASRAVEALLDAGLLSSEEVNEVEHRFCKVKAKILTERRGETPRTAIDG